MALSGTLETFSLPDVLRLLSSTEKSGLLRLEGDRGAGRVWVAGGDVVSAESDSGERDVDGVVFDLLRFAEGAFEFDSGVEPPEDPGAAQPVDDVLVAAEARLEEWREIEAVVPSLDVRVRLVHEVDGEVTVTPPQWRVLARVGAGTSGHRIATQLELGEFEVCRQLRDLIDDRLVEIDEQAPVEQAPVEQAPVEEVAVEEVAVEDGPAAARPTSTQSAPAFGADTVGAPGWRPPEPLRPAVDEPAMHGSATDEPAIEEPVIEEPASDEPAIGAPALDDSAADRPAIDDSPVPTPGPEAPAVAEHDATIELDEHDPATTPERAADGAGATNGDGADDDDDFLSQLSNLSPRAAAAVEATSKDDDPEPAERDLLSSLTPTDEPATSDPGDTGAATESPTESGTESATEGEDDINQNVLLRFLSSAK